MKNDKYIKYFCENIKALRKSNKLSKGKMAKMLGISRKCLSSLEKGKISSDLTVEILSNIANSFGIKPSQMFSSNYIQLD
ncbi:MAG: helix-turn-helix transcriptional regulator [Clostridia bacterium]|nr:helix-turn-helix transcriptional regulator [Clostridia bacterium]MBO5439240.1 helix-turn-helix transcriptional regulator [Clostridia bacterium]